MNVLFLRIGPPRLNPLDYQISDKQTLFARYLVTKIDQKIPYEINPTNVLAATGTGADDMAQSLALGDTFVISPTMVNSFRAFAKSNGRKSSGSAVFQTIRRRYQRLY